MSYDYVNDSILGSVKNALNIPESVEAFDADLVMHINTAFAKLSQLGVGPTEPFWVNGADETWSEFSTDAMTAMARTYVFLEVRLIFDPPTASVLSSMEKKREELEWRLSVACDERPHEQSELGGDQND